MPTFSIITVALNAGSALVETAASVNAQRAVSYEHIVKDGGSQDGSVAALTEQYPATTVVTATDVGIYDAMNQAIATASGDYLHFLNCADRYVDADVLADLSAFARETGCPDLIVTWYYNEQLEAEKRCPQRLSRWFLYRNAIGHQAVYFRRSLLEEIGAYDADLRILADHDLIFRALLVKQASCAIYPRVCVSYDGAGFSNQAENKARKRNEASLIRKRHFARLQRFGFGLAHELSLWRLRSWVAEQKRFPAISRSYNTIASWLNS